MCNCSKKDLKFNILLLSTLSFIVIVGVLIIALLGELDELRVELRNSKDNRYITINNKRDTIEEYNKAIYDIKAETRDMRSLIKSYTIMSCPVDGLDVTGMTTEEVDALFSGYNNGEDR